jgi:hypothetical protein
VSWGQAAADLARIVPRSATGSTSPWRRRDPEEDRWPLLQAATDLLHSVRPPTLLVLEDLHDADRGTLDLLLYLARNLQGARMLVVGAYRDVEVDRAHPLSTALSELHHASNVRRLHLRGLSIEEVQRLRAGTSQQRVPQRFAELVHRQKNGNPLFVREMLRYVIEEGLVEQREGALHRVGGRVWLVRFPKAAGRGWKASLAADHGHESGPQGRVGDRTGVRSGHAPPRHRRHGSRAR